MTFGWYLYRICWWFSLLCIQIFLSPLVLGFNSTSVEFIFCAHATLAITKKNKKNMYRQIDILFSEWLIVRFEWVYLNENDSTFSKSASKFNSSKANFHPQPLCYFVALIVSNDTQSLNYKSVLVGEHSPSSNDPFCFAHC